MKKLTFTRNLQYMSKSLSSQLSFLPNAITCLNLVCGCFAAVMAMQNELMFASFCIFLGGLFDFLDGMFARLLKAYSELGKMLDSMADMVTFGVAPSLMMFQLIKFSVMNTAIVEYGIATLLLSAVSFLIAVFSGLRLAKFNIDTRQTDSFIGVPTPAMAFFVASLPFLAAKFSFAQSAVSNVYILIALVIVLSFLMVAEISMMSLKFKSLNVKKNTSRYVLILVAGVLLAIFNLAAYPFIFIVYLLLSVFEGNVKKKSNWC